MTIPNLNIPSERDPLPEQASGQPDGRTLPPVLEVRGLSKFFGATQALADASIALMPGEVHILLGENGAGKSTLAKIVAGVHAPDAGEIWIAGSRQHPRTAREARNLGVSVVFQELSLAPHLSVAENLFLGAEAASHPFRFLPRARERERARAILHDLNIDLPLDEPVARLSIGKKQLLEIAKALLQSPRILIMDEPTSALTEREKTFLFSMIGRLQDRGTAILYVTHHLREVFEIGSRVSTMRDGRVTNTVTVDDRLSERHLLEMLTGRQIDTTINRQTHAAGPTLLTVSDLHTEDGCHGIDLTLRRGEVVGVYGVVGSGREGLARALMGISKATQGRMTLDGRPYQPGSPAQATALGIGYLAIDRKEQGILPERPIRENLTLASIVRNARFGIVSHRRERDHAEQSLRALRVRYGSMDDPITSLSGGNQQKVLFGRALGRQPKLLVMEEPTAGIDVGAKLDLHESIRSLAAKGYSFLVISSDLPETLMLCDRVYTIYRGRLTDEIHHPCLEDEERVLASVLGRGVGDAFPASTHIEPMADGVQR
ncbi:sugar ABC transporter ATP-binding protein [Azospirillum rugosum]|uniref:Ribose transport system ATP-binding protein n=1 Tax=Azospirillum rugosum TaxID=416170 RepID=A0ABS4SL05_9PROT|nr:sugar ABC transporter ATP-binding protein [Azospirillum rugosum]MBP2293246.1 ribose transport system ATP-binding protein [Azospirillum rugosum]